MSRYQSKFLILILLSSLLMMTNISTVVSTENLPVRFKKEQTDNVLHLSIIWHQHQPNYIDPSTGIYEQPWVYMHSTNSYPWMADLHKKYPDVNATMNITPSLLNQLDGYTSGEAFDRRMEIAKIPEGQMSDENKTIVLRFFFDINPQFVTGRYQWLQNKSNEHPTMAEKISAFTNEEIYDLKVLFYLRWINKEYRSYNATTGKGDFRLANMDFKIDNEDDATSYSDAHFSRANNDLEYVLSKGLGLAKTTVSKHVSAQSAGNLEMITTPFYHPILPLLLDLKNARQSPGNQKLPLPSGSTGWEQDAQEQIDRGVQFFIEHYDGSSPKGMWPSEQAVSKEVISLMNNAGINWFVSDRNVLRNSLGVTELSDEQLYRMYSANDDGTSVASVFRDTRISDDIGFVYSGMHPENASDAFVNSIKTIYDKLDFAQLNNDEDYIVTVALDGENAWEHYTYDIDDDGENEYTGNHFRELMYQKIQEAQDEGWLKTTTPSQFLQDHPLNSLPDIDQLASGSWISGELNTWIGEPAENIAWDWLIDARNELVASDTAGTTKNSTAAWNALYAAQGSDWFWWYGADQSSGRDELFDWGFKTFVRRVYSEIGFSDQEILQKNPLLFLRQSPIIPGAYPTKMKDYTIDGSATQGEWEDVSYYINDSIVETNAVQSFYSGINDASSDLLFRVDLTTDPDRRTNDEFVGLYFNDPRAPSGDIYPLGVERDDIGNTLGFQLNFAVTFQFNDSSVRLWKNDGSGWKLNTSVSATVASSENVLEMEIPLDFFQFTSGDFFQVAVYYTGLKADIAPEDGPVSFQVPFSGADFTVIFEMNDPEGDEYGDYALAPDFDPGFGLFDILDFKVGYDEDNFIVSVKMAEIRNPWGAPAGYSHPLIQVYIDQDRISGSGNTEPDQNANVLIHEDFAWERLVRADGWLTYGLHQNGSEFGGVATSADLLETTITIQAPLEQVGTPTEGWAYVVLVGSQDFQAFRERLTEASTWKLGGGDDGPYDPNVVDMLVPKGVDQKQILDSYSVADTTFAKMIGVGPNVESGIDETPPSITILSPEDGERVSFEDNTLELEIEFEASDDITLDHFDLFVDNILKTDDEPLTEGKTTIIVNIERDEIDGIEFTIRINVYDGSNEDIANFAYDEITIRIREGLRIPFPIFPSIFVFGVIPILRKSWNQTNKSN